MFEPKVYINRREKLQNLMSDGIILILGNPDAPMNYPGNIYHYRQDSTFLYFFGLDHPGFAGVIDIDKNMHCIVGNDVDIDDIIWMGPQPTVKDMAAKVGIENTAPSSRLAEVISKAVEEGRKIHFLPPYRAENKILIDDLLGIKPSEVKEKASVELIKACVELRSVKEECEIVEIEKACTAGYEMHTTAMKLAKEGIYEREIAGKVEGIALAHGGMLSFPIILSQHGETLHNHDHSQLLENGKLMLVDTGAETPTHYASDNTRTIPVGGKFTPKQKEIYEIVLKANVDAIEAIKPGVSFRDIHFISARVIIEGLKKVGIMKGDVDEALKAGAHTTFFPHGLGHMMGLDVHDMEDYGENYVGYDDEIKRADQFGTAYLRLGRKLQPGFVITVEPGIYFIPDLIDKFRNEGKFMDFINYDKLEEYKTFGGIRLEDDILVTEDGWRLLGPAIPKTVEEVEAITGKGL